MREPTVHMPGSAFGDALGISWILSDIGGARLVGHDGSTNGQKASLSFLPGKDWALAVMTNASPGGLVLNRIARQRVLTASGRVTFSPESHAIRPCGDVVIWFSGTVVQVVLTRRDNACLSR